MEKIDFVIVGYYKELLLNILKFDDLLILIETSDTQIDTLVIACGWRGCCLREPEDF